MSILSLSLMLLLRMSEMEFALRSVEERMLFFEDCSPAAE